MIQKFAIIENGKVVNIAVSETALEPNWIPSDVANIGDEYVDGQFVTSSPDMEALKVAVRYRRDSLLASCDWRMLKDLEAGQPLNFDWASYRQALRDVPQQLGFPAQINWPTPPGGS